jgi:REP element-mobilizing transposase RayT
MVFSTVHRTPLITADIKPKLHGYMAGALRNIKSVPFIVGGVEDHVHLLLGLSRTLSIAQTVEKVKTSSSKWMKDEGHRSFAWQLGYGAFSVGIREVEVIETYIRNQESHHRSASFKEEYLSLLNEYRVDYDEKYMWD